MFTSRAEYRLRLRQDNADLRLTPHALRLGTATTERSQAFRSKKESMERLVQETLQTSMEGISLAQWLRRTGNFPSQLPSDLDDRHDPAIWDLVVTDLQYEGYLKREEEQIERQRTQEHQPIPRDLDYDAIPSLRLEARQKFREYTPETLGKASRISGITPSDISVLAVWVRKVSA
jgi:tRNA uridine 5-carboxymethylaminomethyl modification enzyme